MRWRTSWLERLGPEPRNWRAEVACADRCRTPPAGGGIKSPNVPGPRGPCRACLGPLSLLLRFLRGSFTSERRASFRLANRMVGTAGVFVGMGGLRRRPSRLWSETPTSTHGIRLPFPSLFLPCNLFSILPNPSASLRH